MLQFFFSGGSHGFTFFLLRGIPKLLRNSLRKGMWPAAWLAFRPAASRRGAVVHGASICSPDRPWPSAGLTIRQQPGRCSKLTGGRPGIFSSPGGGVRSTEISKGI